MIKPPRLRATALITGAAKRVGAETARALAADGWAVAIHCRASVDEAEALARDLRAAGAEAGVASADLAADGAAEAIFAQISGLPPVTALVLNASHFEKDALETLSRERFDAHMHTNLYASLDLIRAFAAQLPEGQAGNVVALLDGMRGWSLSAHFLSYSLSRLAFEAALPMLARELAPPIRINAVAPGLTLPGKMDGPDSFARLAERAPLGRISGPGEVVAAIRYFLGAPSVTGQILNLSGGMPLCSP